MAAMLLAAVVGLASKEVAGQTTAAMPDHPSLVMSIRNTLAAVNHGALTGNYTVLRDLSSERFRRQNTAADIAKTFENLRQQRLDLSPVLIHEPQLTEPPTIDRYQRLRLAGYVPTRPRAVRFQLLFQHVEGGWVIDEVSLEIAPVEPVAPLERLPPSEPQTAQAGDPRAAN